MNDPLTFNLQTLKYQAYRIYHHQYFQYIISVVFFTLAFTLGRILHEKRFSNLLNMINDAETTSRKLTQEKIRINQKIQYTQSKKYLVISVLLVVVLAFAAYTYLIVKKVQVTLLIQVGASLIAILLLIWLRLKYLKWKRKSLQNKLQQSVLTTENELKQILSEIGVEIQKCFKYKFEKEIEQQKKIQENKQCNLSKCYHQKKDFLNLFALYKNIISELIKFNWCNVCASQTNINTVELKIAELDSNLLLYQRLSKDSKFPLDKQKQMINRMLEEWSILQPKLPLICKRGCCIKFRELTDSLKKQHYKCMSELKGKLKSY